MFQLVSGLGLRPTTRLKLLYLFLMMDATAFEEQFSRLKKHIEFKAGFRIAAYADCKQLVKLLRQEKIAISALTIARVFRLSGGVKRPYTSTLDLLSRFVGFHSFSNFELESEQFSKKWLFGHDIQTTDFSLQALELAIHECDWQTVKVLLEASNPDVNDYEFPMFLGNAVRNHSNREAFLQALMEVDVGRVYFFDRFVDEDDPDNYFSDALDRFNEKFELEESGKLFKFCFQIAKKFYRNERFDQSPYYRLVDIDWKEQPVHFHLISRWYEVQVIFLLKNNRPFSVLESTLLELTELLPRYEHPAQCWLLARPLKALIHGNMIATAMKIPELKCSVLDLQESMGNRVKSIGELIVQLVAHAIFRYEHGFILPKKISTTHLNETYSRIAVESATAHLYSNKYLKNIILKNLKPFAKRTGNSWVLNLLENS
jgi:hypothetical protein